MPTSGRYFQTSALKWFICTVECNTTRFITNYDLGITKCDDYYKWDGTQALDHKCCKCTIKQMFKISGRQKSFNELRNKGRSRALIQLHCFLSTYRSTWLVRMMGNNLRGCLHEKPCTGARFIPGRLFDFVPRLHDDWVISYIVIWRYTSCW